MCWESTSEKKILENLTAKLIGEEIRLHSKKEVKAVSHTTQRRNAINEIKAWTSCGIQQIQNSD